jgi:FMNH2-dependent dimethyl sulfone monooxygenase
VGRRRPSSYGLQFDQHDDRYARTTEWLKVVDGLWIRRSASASGFYMTSRDAIVEPKPLSVERRIRSSTPAASPRRPRP